MSITFRQLVTPWSGVTPAASGSFTPNAAGDALLALSIDTSIGSVMSMTGTSTYAFGNLTCAAVISGTQFLGLSVGNNQWDNSGQTMGVGSCAAAVAGAQTASAVSNQSGDTVMGLILDYSGVGRVDTGCGGLLVNPASAPSGVSIGVPTSSVLVAICVCPGSSAALTNSNGTSRGSGTWNGQAYSVSEFVGVNSNVTPGWTQTGAPYASQNYDIYYFLLTPTGGATPLYVVQSASAAESGEPWSCTLSGSVPIGDLIIAVLAGGGAGAAPNPFPVSVSDNVNSGPYTALNPIYNSGQGFYGAIFYKVANASGTPTINATSADGATSFLGAVSVSGFGSNTPTVDAGASVNGSGSGATQGGSVSSAFANEILLCAPWNNGDIGAPVPGWFPTGIGYDNTYWAVLNTPQANNFSGAYGGTEWLSVFGGIYSAAPAVAAAIVAWLT